MSLRRWAKRAPRLPVAVRRWISIARARPRPASAGIRVYYGRDRLPHRGEVAHGGTIKLQALADVFDNSPRDFNVLYLGSSTMPDDALVLVRLARRRHASFVWNQNGVAYLGWHGPGWERTNRPRARLLSEADHVIYQSEFCKLSSDRFYGKAPAASEVLHNPVDTKRFTPRSGPRATNGLTLLLGGKQYQRYRLEAALETLRLLPGSVRLTVTGDLCWDADRRRCRQGADALVRELGLESRVEFTGPYRQQDAPELFRGGDILLHTKYNDPCPTVVLEAMASGLPVVYSASGGTPELVGGQAGIGVPAPLDWERDHPPDAEQLAEAVHELGERLDEASEAARARAESFDVRAWIERHRQLFEELLR